jgi:PhnB protein
MTRPLVRGLSAHLFVEDADRAIEFYRRAFGGIEVFRNQLPDGRLLFVELALGEARLLLSEPFPGLDATPAPADTVLPLLLHLDVDDPDEVADRVILLGGSVEQAVEEQFWGERYGVVRDPFGFRWSISTVRQTLGLEDVADRTPPRIPD